MRRGQANGMFFVGFFLLIMSVGPAVLAQEPESSVPPPSVPNNNPPPPQGEDPSAQGNFPATASSSPEKSFLSVPAVAFQPTPPATFTITDDGIETTDMSASFTAPLHLPHGAKLLKITAVFVRKANGPLVSEQSTFTLKGIRRNQTPTGSSAGSQDEAVFAEIDVKNPQKQGFISQDVVASKSLSVVSNSRYHYDIAVELTAGLGLRGVRIQYEVPTKSGSAIKMPLSSPQPQGGSGSN